LLDWIAASRPLPAAEIQVALATHVCDTSRSSKFTADDPWEPVNRKIYRLNKVIDAAAVRPIAITYKHVLPRPVRTGLRHAAENLDEPLIAANDILQARLGRAASATARFVTNSTLGLAGVLDVAKKAGLARHDTGFDDTLARWGLDQGPYLYLPLVGPSDLRAGFGGVVDFLADPLNFVSFRHSGEVALGAIAVEAIDARVAVDRDLKTLDRTFVDPYATTRSIYLQLDRQKRGEVQLEDLPTFPDEREAPAKGDPPPLTVAPLPNPPVLSATHHGP
jgi:phospholipid-binding lipoprotein MlaA